MKNTIRKMFEGRLSRRNYIFGLLISFFPFLIIFGSYFILKLISVIFGVELMGGSFISIIYVIIGLLTMIWLILVTFSLIVKRLHDLNRKWYYILIPILLIPVLKYLISPIGDLFSLLWGLYLMIKIGSKGKNDYGEEDKPKGLKKILGI